MNKAAAFLNRILTPTGFEIRARARTLSEQQSLPRLDTAGHIIEFVGTQGIGKSTLCNAVQKRLCDRWFFRSDLNQTGPAPGPAIEIEDIHAKLYFQRICQLKNGEDDAWQNITRSQQAARVIGENLTLMTNAFPRGFILDEGLFKNFPQEVLKATQNTSFDAFWQNRALIHLRAHDAASVIERYTARAAERQQRGLLQRTPDEKTLRARIEAENTLFDEMMETARNRGCATLLLLAEDTHENNIARIVEFERSRFAMTISAS